MTTTKFITSYYAGYVVPANTNIYVISTGYIGASGLLAHSTTTITNDGRIVTGPGRIYSGVDLYAGGVVVNGSAAYTGALIQGHRSGVALYAAGAVSNFGTIRGVGDISYGGGFGIDIAGAGTVTNGTNRDTGATVSGYTAIALEGVGTVTNYGVIDGLGAGAFDDGVSLAAGGTVINGSGTDRTALIEGGGAIAIGGAAGTIRNSGTLLATSYGFAAMLDAGGTLANGSLNNSHALIQGSSGIYISGASATNLGVISAVGDYGVGASLASGASLVNGAAGHASAMIEGVLGVYGAPSSPGMTVTNFGTIAGTGGTALLFASVSDELVVEAGCAFQGAVSGGGGSLDLASGAGTLSGLAGGNVTVSGSMATTTFSNFDAVIVGAGASFVDTGAVTVAAGDVLSAQGSLTIGGKAKASVVNAGEIQVGGLTASLLINGAVTNTGTLDSFGGTMTVTGAVTGKGVVQLNGISTIHFVAGFTENVTFETASFATLELGQSQGYTGTITGFSTVGGSMLDLDDIAFVSASEATYSGTSTSGVLTVTDGTHTAHINLKGNYLASTFVCASDGHGGTIIHDPTRAHASAAAAQPLTPIQPFAAAMASLGGGPGEASHAGGAWTAPAPTLSRPRTGGGVTF